MEEEIMEYYLWDNINNPDEIGHYGDCYGIIMAIEHSDFEEGVIGSGIWINTRHKTIENSSHMTVSYNCIDCDGDEGEWNEWEKMLKAFKDANTTG